MKLANTAVKNNTTKNISMINPKGIKNLYNFRVPILKAPRIDFFRFSCLNNRKEAITKKYDIKKVKILVNQTLNISIGISKNSSCNRMNRKKAGMFRKKNFNIIFT